MAILEATIGLKLVMTKNEMLPKRLHEDLRLEG